MKNKLMALVDNFLVPMTLMVIVATAGVVGVVDFFESSTLKADLTEKNTRKIVVFHQNVKEEGAKENVIKKRGGKKVKHLKLINAVVADIDSISAEAALLSEADVLRIDEDILVEINKKGNANNPKDQIIPWGIERVGAPAAQNQVTGPRQKVAIIDTGIDLDHPDLQANIKGSYNAIDPTISADDDHGHGSHVAGVIAAVDNKFGVVGAGPKIKLYAAKAISKTGSGYLSDIIEGIDWAIANDVAVINMSIGTPANIRSFHEAVQKAYDAGITVVCSAGNTRSSVHYPAAYPETIAVSAVAANDTFAWWSNRGPQIDLSAPGVYIYSALKNGGYGFKNGTSMAAPHVTAAAALVQAGFVSLHDADGDGDWDPDEVKLKLRETAEDLGPVGFDIYYGAGILDVEAALAR